MPPESPSEKGQSSKIRSESQAKSDIAEIENRIVPLDDELANLLRKRLGLYRQRDMKRADISNIRTSLIGRIQSVFSRAQAELADIEQKIAELHDQIRIKAQTILSGLTQRDNSVYEFLKNDPEYRKAEVVQTALAKAKMNAGMFEKGIHNAQTKIEGALVAGANEEAALVGADAHLQTEKYNKEAAQSLALLKMNASAFHTALTQYASTLEKTSGWKVKVAIDKENRLNVDLLSHPEYMDVYTPEVLENIRAQLGVLNTAIKEVFEQIAESDADLQRQKNDYEHAMKKRFSGHHFNDVSFYKEFARGVFEKEEQQEEESDAEKEA